MAIKMIAVKCPNCDAKVELDESREFGFCSYCGYKILIQNDNKFEHIYRTIDEAAIKTSKDKIELRRLEIEEQKRKDKRRDKENIVGFGLVFFLLVVVPIIVQLLFD